jgi:hypothetical protein
MTRAAILAGLALSASGCTSSNTECDCSPARLHVNVPEERALDVSGVSLSGPACAGVTPGCDGLGVAGGCVEYGFQAAATGDCHVDVDFASGEVFSADVNITQVTGCCAGLYADPASAGEIDVPGAADAGQG